MLTHDENRVGWFVVGSRAHHRSCWAKVGLSASELEAAHRRIATAKLAIAGSLAELERIIRWKDKYTGAVALIPDVAGGGAGDEESDDGIDIDDIACAECGRDDDKEGNDIVLCDGICGRAYHQMCVDPPLLALPAEDEGWLCPPCATKEAVVMDINSQFETEYDIDTMVEDFGVLHGTVSTPATEVERPSKDNGGGGGAGGSFLTADFPSDDEDDDDDFSSGDETDEDEEGGDDASGDSDIDSDVEDEDEDQNGGGGELYEEHDEFPTTTHVRAKEKRAGSGLLATSSSGRRAHDDDHESHGRPGRRRSARGSSPRSSAENSPRTPLRAVPLSTVHSPQSACLNRKISAPRSASVKPSGCRMTSRREARRSKPVDYRSLALELFGSVNGGVHEDEDDNDWSP